MKKVLLTIAAVAALASCTKSEVEYTPAKEITFTPVSKNITKAMMDNGEVFNTEEMFNVWAFYNPTITLTDEIDLWVSQYKASEENGAKVYIDNKAFEYDETHKLWAGSESPYFWPKVGSLAFAGYHPTTASATYELEGDKNVMTFPNVKRSWVTTDTNNNEDLMYFNLTKAYEGNNVVAVFKHALSWITINVATTQETLTAKATIKVSSVKFTNVMPQGTGSVVNQNSIAWALEGDDEPVETIADPITSPVTLDVNPRKLKEPLFIPQPMDGNLEITYTIESPKDKDGVISSFTETKVIKLNTLKDEDEKALTEWEAAKHYIYNIVIGTEEILIDASVVNWTYVTIPVNVNKTPSNTEGTGSDSDDSESGSN